MEEFTTMVSTPLANSISHIRENEARYDNQAKRLLADPQVLTRILKGTIEEFSEMSLEDIGHAIKGTIEISDSFKDKLAMSSVDEKKQESYIPDEGEIVFDIKCRAVLPEEMVDIIINVEAQKSSKETVLRYPLDKRIIYYLSRLVSEQKDTYFFNSDYGRIKKVTSIWICMDAAADKDSINEICFTQKSLFGEPVELNNLNLMRAYIISIRKDDNPEKSKNNLIAMLEVLFGSDKKEIKKKRLVDEHQMIMTTEFESEVNDMCNLSQVVKEKGIAEGRAEGRAEGATKERLRTINKMLQKGYSSEDILELGFTSEEINEAEKSLFVDV